MSIFTQFPYTNYHELNLDWIIRQMKQLQSQVSTMAVDHRTFDNMAALLTDSTVGPGSVVYIDGYYTANDGGDGFWHIDETDGGLGVQLDSGLYANPIICWCYNLKQLGAHADGLTSDFDIIQGLISKIHNGVVPNRPVFAPAGRYAVNDCIVIPSNIWLFGDGPSTYFYLNRSATWLGGVIGVCGSNVTLENFSGGYLGGAEAQIYFTQGQQGFIGIGPGTYEGWLNHEQVVEEHKNITIRDIWTDCQYCLQTENTDAGSGIENVLYENIHAPNSLVSVQGKTPHSIRNVTMKNIEAAVIRLGQGNTVDNLVLDGFRTELLINRNRGSVIMNGMSEIHMGSKAYNSRIWENYGNAPIATKTGCTMINVTANANNILNDGINIETSAAGTLESEPVNIENSTAYGAVNYQIHGAGYLNAVNCVFDPTQPSRINAKHARLVNCQLDAGMCINVNRTYKQTLELETDYENYTESFPMFCEVSGNWAHVVGAVNNANGFTAGETIATLPAAASPEVSRYGFATIFNKSHGIGDGIESTQVPIVITNAGEISIGSATSSAEDLAACNLVKIDFVYPILDLTNWNPGPEPI